jgi:UDP-3-O-[3-hydroxymyristoyl] N-acetylglucosamine deacetylase
MNKQIIIANKVSCSGVGLHNGLAVTMTLHPAAANTGIVFKRLDVPKEHALIPARYDAVVETRLGTTIRNAFNVSVATIEHVMAALWGAGVDNVLIELTGAEVPIMDGSSEPFTFMLECAGFKHVNAARRVIKILKTVEVREEGSIARVSPNLEGEEGCVLDIEIEFAHKAINRQVASYDFRDVTFKQALSRARTFGFEHEVEALRSMGLARGGSLENAIVLGKDGVLNEGGLRYDDEFVRHKALDCIGDLYLAGYRIDGHFDFTRPGHAINNTLLRTLLADETAYVVTQSDSALQPVVPGAPKSIPAYV